MLGRISCIQWKIMCNNINDISINKGMVIKERGKIKSANTHFSESLID